MGEVAQIITAFLSGSALVIGAVGLYRRRMAAAAESQFEKSTQALQFVVQQHADQAKMEYEKRKQVEREFEAYKAAHPPG